MKEYALFAGQNYYALGGAADFMGWFDSVNTAQQYAEDNRSKIGGDQGEDVWAQVADSETMQPVSYRACFDTTEWFDPRELSNHHSFRGVRLC